MTLGRSPTLAEWSSSSENTANERAVGAATGAQVAAVFMRHVAEKDALELCRISGSSQKTANDEHFWPRFMSETTLGTSRESAPNESDRPSSTAANPEEST